MSSLQSNFIRFMLRKSNLWNKPLVDIRKTMETIKAKPLPENVAVKRVELKGVPCDKLSIKGHKSKKVIIYYHGGGFCMGVYPANREFVAKIAAGSHMDTFLPDYRLAPENPFPAALEDAVATYRALLEMGYREKDIIIMGDSSGCALALSSILSLKQSSIGMPCAILCITPVFDLAGKGESFRTRAKKDPFQLTDPLGIAKNYFGDIDPISPKLSPLYGDLKGLPPIMIHAADQDVFLSDSIRFTDQAKKSGVSVTLKVWDNMWHIFPMQESLVPEAKKALEELCSQLKSFT